MFSSYDPLTGRAPARQPSPFRSKQVVVTLDTPDHRVKIFRIDWLKSEVGLMVGLPYFSPSHGLLGRYELRLPPGGQTQISLLDGGKVTTHPVKMSFHKSGVVLFSQSNKIDPGIRTKVAPLVGGMRRLFEIYVRGTRGFEPTEPKDEFPPNAGRAVWNLSTSNAGDVGFKIVGRWVPLSILTVVRSEPGYFGRPNLVHLQEPDGETASGFLFSPIPAWPWGGFGLLLSQEPWSIETGHAKPYILARGGFGRLKELDKPVGGLTFLAAMYTDRTAELDDLTRDLGTVDLSTD
jgi:hypothetical protein